MIQNNEGLTKTYNRFHDPDERSPQICPASQASLSGWTAPFLTPMAWGDIATGCEFLLDYEIDDEEESGRNKRKPWRYRWPDDVRDEVLARLIGAEHRTRAWKSGWRVASLS